MCVKAPRRQRQSKINIPNVANEDEIEDSEESPNFIVNTANEIATAAAAANGTLIQNQIQRMQQEITVFEQFLNQMKNELISLQESIEQENNNEEIARTRTTTENEAIQLQINRMQQKINRLEGTFIDMKDDMRELQHVSSNSNPHSPTTNAITETTPTTAEMVHGAQIGAGALDENTTETETETTQNIQTTETAQNIQNHLLPDSSACSYKRRQSLLDLFRSILFAIFLSRMLGIIIFKKDLFQIFYLSEHHSNEF